MVWRTEAGDKQILKLLGPGDLLEVEALYSEESHSTYARVLEDAYVAFIDKGSFFRLMEKNPALNLEVIARLARDSKHFQRELVMHAYRGVKERLCKLLWELAEKYGVESENEGSLMINIRLTHAELAEMIGSSRETVTECLCTLKERGLISYSHHRITICDVSSFESSIERLS